MIPKTLQDQIREDLAFMIRSIESQEKREAEEQRRMIRQVIAADPDSSPEPESDIAGDPSTPDKV